MRFNTGELPPGVLHEVEVGNVYPAQGNKPTVAWIVAALRERRAVLIGIDAEGNVCGAQVYGQHAMEDRPLIGRCPGIAAMTLDVEWLGPNEGRRFRG